VYSLDLDTKQWTPVTFSGGPGQALRNGTYNRWSYSPKSGVFVVINSVDSNAWALRLGAAPPPDTSPPANPAGLRVR
jgi:hypothetical protein